MLRSESIAASPIESHDDDALIALLLDAAALLLDAEDSSQDTAILLDSLESESG